MQIGRVNGNLAVSRALGDFVYKDSPHLPEHAQKVSAEADLTVFERSVWCNFARRLSLSRCAAGR